MCDIPAEPGANPERWCKCRRETFEAAEVEREALAETIRYQLSRAHPNLKSLRACVDILTRGVLTFYDSEGV